MYNGLFNIMYDMMTEMQDKELEEEYRKYKCWYYKEQGMKAPDTKQLEWMLSNPEISDSMKRIIIMRIQDESGGLEDEMTVLLRAGGLSSKAYADYVERYTKSRYDHHLGLFRWGIVGVAVFSVISLLLMIAVWWSGPPKAFQFITFMFYTFTVSLLSAFVQYVIEMWQKASNAACDAENSRYEKSGYKLQEYIARIEERKEWIDGLCGVAAVYENNVAVNNENISD